MIYPTDELCLTLRKIYCDEPVRILFTSFAFKFTHYHEWTPYLICATEQHIFLTSYNQKDEKKQIKIYSLKEAQLIENEDVKFAKFEAVATLEINEDEYVFRFLRQADINNWNLLINKKVPPVLMLKNQGDVYEREGFELNLSQTLEGYFSELCVSKEEFDEAEVKERLSIEINLGDFSQLFNVDHGLLLNQGNLIAKYEEKTQEEFQSQYELQYINVEQLFASSDEDLYRKNTYYSQNWNEVYLQKVKQIEDLYKKYKSYEEIQFPKAEEQQDNANIRVDAPSFVQQSLLQLLKTKKASPQMEQLMMETDELQTPTDSLTGAIAGLCQFLGDFRERCCELAKQMVDEFCLPDSEKSLLDYSVQTNEAKMALLQGEIQEQYTHFLAHTKAIDENILEDAMTKLGPVHGSISISEEYPNPCYQQLLCQAPDWILGTQPFSLPPPPGELPQLAVGEANGYPGGLMDENKDEAVYVPEKAIYPNEFPPTYEVHDSNIIARFAVDQSNHCNLNNRRDFLFEAKKDDIVCQQAAQEIDIIQAIFDNNEIDNRKDLFQAPLTCMVTYQGFTVYCHAEILESEQVFGYHDDLQLINQPKGNDEQFAVQAKNTAEYLNIQPHLVQARVKTGMQLNSQKISPSFSDQQLIQYIVDNLQQVKSSQKLSAFLKQFSREIVLQIPCITYDDVYSDLAEDIYQEIQLSSLLEVYSEQNGQYYMKNCNSIAMPDLPTYFVKNILPKLTKEQLSQVSHENRLPVKYTKILNEKYQPDFELVNEQTMTQTVELIENLAKLEDKKVIKDLSKRKFSEYIIAELFSYEYQRTLEQYQSVSDIYRTTYLPLLMQSIDQKIFTNALKVYEIPDLFKYFEIPTYLWLYTANFSKLGEVFDYTKLSVAARAISNYLNQNLRRIRREIQQFGIRNIQQYDGQENAKDDVFLLEKHTQNIINESNSKRMNFFTAQTAEERQQMVSNVIMQYIINLLNCCFGLNKNTKVFWQIIDKQVEVYYYDHSFAKEYTLDALAQFSGQIQANRAVYEHFTQQYVFSDGIGFKSALTVPDRLKCLNVQSRLLLLELLQQYSGVVVSDVNTYDFLSERPFEVSDVIQHVEMASMPLDSFVQEYCNVPYRRWLPAALEVEAEITNEFSYRVQIQGACANTLARYKRQFFRTEALNAALLFKQFHYNLAFDRFSNLNNDSFEYLLAEAAIALSNSLAESAPPEEYFAQKQACYLCMQSALSICRRNAPAGVQMYSYLLQMLAQFETLEKRLKIDAPDYFLQVSKQQSEQLLKIRIFETTSLEAFQLTIQAAVNVFGNSSFETAKLRYLYAIAQYAQQNHKQALEQLKFAEETVLSKMQANCIFLQEVYNFMGVIFGQLGEFQIALSYLDKAFNVAWYWLNEYNIQKDKLEGIRQKLQNDIAVYESAKVEKPKQIKFKFVEDSDKDIYVQSNALNASQSNLNTSVKSNVSIMNDSFMQKQLVENQPNIEEQEDVQELLVSAQNSLNTITHRVEAQNVKVNSQNLYISQIYENHARICEKFLRYSNKDDLTELKNCAVKALKLRNMVLGKTHYYTIAALILVAQTDLKLNDTQKGLTGLEFALRAMPQDSPAEDLNSVGGSEQVSRLKVFRMLVYAFLQSLPKEYQQIVDIAHKIAISRAAAPEKMNATVQKVCSSANICQEIMKLVESAANAETQEDIDGFIYLLQYVSDEELIELDESGANEVVYERMEEPEQRGDAQESEGQNRQDNDDEMY